VKQIIKTGLAALVLLLAISCKKENSTNQSSSISGNSSMSDDITDINAPANIVKIGTQVWMKSNLNVSRYRNGDPIPEVKDRSKWDTLTTGAWCWYKNDSTNGPIYGRLYNWYAVNDPRGLAPAGWHVSSDSEWTMLTRFLGGDSVAGGKMKLTGTLEAGTGLWYAPNTDATNTSGFTGLPGGYRNNRDGSFYGIGVYGSWWSSTARGPHGSWRWELFYDHGYDYRYSLFWECGFSVRCVKD
jgi:uncharacterized protein (TIGR02145 family)